jgi:hypothetical protein
VTAPHKEKSVPARRISRDAQDEATNITAKSSGRRVAMMSSYTQGAKRRSAFGPSTKEVASEIKARITIPILAQQLFPVWKPDRSCLSPFRQEKKESVSVFANGRR